MGVSAVARYMAFPPMPPAVAPAGAGAPATGLSERDQLAVVGARPAALRNAARVATNLASSDPASTGSASGQGSLDTYL
ncbi:MAG TPA: hypothetical protein VFP72_20565 [Kineosporiaceae bacterium]|nr:hypothetical protein [Kineosporiaceae bacterium]